MANTGSSGGPARVTVVTSPACHFCDDARAALAVLAQTYPIAVRLVAADSPPGQELLSRHGTGMFPLVLVDEEFFAAGRLPRRKLARLLAERACGAGGGAAAVRTGTR